MHAASTNAKDIGEYENDSLIDDGVEISHIFKYIYHGATMIYQTMVSTEIRIYIVF